MTEKRTPHYSLVRMQELIRQGSYRVSRTALSTARRDFGLADVADVAEAVCCVTRVQFYKSMTTYESPKVWQDVYRSSLAGSNAYLKLQILDENTVVISFKQLENE